MNRLRLLSRNLPLCLALAAFSTACEKKPMDKNDPMAQAFAKPEHADLDIGKIEAGEAQT